MQVSCVSQDRSAKELKRSICVPAVCLLRKHEPSINEDVSVIDANQHAVHANLTQTPYWQDPEGRTLTRWGPRERSVWLPLQSGSQMFCAIALYVQATTLASAAGL